MTSSPAVRPWTGQHRLVATALRSPARAALGRLTLLQYVASDGRAVRLPVQYAPWRSELVLAAGRAEGKTWWRAFRSPRRATVLVDGTVVDVVGHVVTHDDPLRPAMAAAYAMVHTMAHLDHAELVLLQRL